MRTLMMVVTLLVWCRPAAARDFFVRAGASAGDGTRERPFADPWHALERVEPGDRVHVAAGQYVGRLERGNWVIPSAGVQLLGGYDSTFRTRNPWKNVTELTWKASALNRPDLSAARVVSGDQRDTPGATLDGFLIDLRETLLYDGGPSGSLNPLSLDRPGAVDLHSGGVLKNCVIVNASTAVTARPGAVIENNVIVNSTRAAITVRGADGDPPVAVRHNTIAFVWDERVPGEGGTAGHGVVATGPVVLDGNLIVHADNHAISLTKVASATVTGNAFHRNLFSNLFFFVDGKPSSLDDGELDADEDVGLRKAGGNVALDPKLPFDAYWYDAFLKRTAGRGKRFTPAQWAETRAAAGLPASTDTLALFAPAYPALAALELIAPKNAAATQGARAVALPVSFSAPAAAAPSKRYSKLTLAALEANAKGFDGQAVEVVVGIMGPVNPAGVAGLTPETHAGCFLVDEQGSARTPAFFRHGTAIERTVDASSSSGSGAPHELFTARGTLRVTTSYPHRALLLDAIEPADRAFSTPERPAGREWYVRAGESQGDGSREHPFRDPFQALDKAGPGDRINVTEGDYGGKLKSGTWVVDKPWLALLGGWNRDFTTRDPWRTPTVLQWPADSKTRAHGALLEGSGDHTGLLVDGFVFDRRTLNTYDADGFLDPGRSDDTEHLWVVAPHSTVRNCTFVNGAGGAVRLSNAVTFENNLIANVWHTAIRVTGGFGARPALIRNNTVLFVFEPRFHDASTSSGVGLVVEPFAGAVIEGNAFQYIDNLAVKANTRLGEVELVNNTFFRNFTVFQTGQGMPPPTVDEKNLNLLNDLPFKRQSGNQVLDGEFEIDPGVYASWLKRTSTATTRFTEAEWNALARPLPATTPVKPGVGAALEARTVAAWVPKNAQARGARPRLK